MSDTPAKDEKPAAAAAAAVEEQKAEAAKADDKKDKADDKAGDKADEKPEKKAKGKGKKAAAAAAAAGDAKPKKKTLAQQRAEAETLVEDPKKDLGAPAEVLAEGAKRRADAKPKPPAQYTPQDWKAKSKEVTIPKGKGTKIEDCENVLKAVNKLKGDDASLKGLHALMFGAVGEAKKRKSHIREFSGFDADTVDEVKVKKLASLNQKKVDALKQYAAILDLEVSGAKSELAERIVEFLAKPKPSGKPYKSLAGAKRKRSKSTKSKKGDKEKTPRGPSAYILFANAKRAEVQEKYPDKKMTEVAKVLGEMWGDLSDTKKNEWKAKAKAAKPGDGKKRSKSKSKDKKEKKSKKSKQKDESDDDESGSDSSSDEEGSGSDSDAKPMSDDEDDKKKKSKKEKKEKPAKKEKKDKKEKKEKSEKPKKEKKAKKEKEASDDEAEAPKKKKQKSEKSDKPDDKIKAATKKAVMEGDSSMSVKTVLEQLKEKFGEDAITTHKPTIKQWINDFFAEKMKGK